jgi:hypothetical protein
MAFNLQLRKFDMSSIPDESVVVMLGKRNTGKSFLTRDLLYNKRDIPVHTIISGTESVNKFYSKMIPPIFIHDEFNPTIIANFLKRQKKITKMRERDEEIVGKGNSTIDNRALLIFDDLMDDASTWIKDKNVKKVFIAGRHFRILYIVLLQFSLGISTTLRGNIDFIFILRENIMSNRKRIYENYAGMFPTFELFCSVLDQCTENYECLVINNMSKSNQINEQVFWYKAEQHPDFKMGPPEIWNYCAEKFVEDKDDDDELDLSYYTNKRKGPKLHVKKLTNN